MDITLEKVREILRPAFGGDSFVAACIKNVTADKEVPTACITAAGEMRYNPQFVAQYVQRAEDLFCLVCHELFHPLFGHFVHASGKLENIAADMVINAAITHLFPNASC